MSKKKQTENEELFSILSDTINGANYDDLNDAVYRILGIANYHRKQEWISVDERLPEDGVWVLGYSAKRGRGGLCNCLKSYVREFGNYDDTTHWLPLPEFPKKGE